MFIIWAPAEQSTTADVCVCDASDSSTSYDDIAQLVNALAEDVELPPPLEVPEVVIPLGANDPEPPTERWGWIPTEPRHPP